MMAKDKKAPETEPTPVLGGAIDISDNVPTAEFLEILRLWVDRQGTSQVYVRPRLKQPELYGRLLAQGIAQGARAYAAEQKISVEEATQRIWAGLDSTRITADGKAA